MSEGEGAKPRRRRGRRRSSRAAGPPQQGSGRDSASPQSPDRPQESAPEQAPPRPEQAPSRQSRQRRRSTPRLRTVHETSAGGLVIDGIDRPREEQLAALIGRMDRRGRMLWSLPKGHIEQGETAEETAIREVAEETGIHGHVLAALGSIDYWFVTEGRRVHKTVHHYLLRFSGGELCDEDVEVTEVAWVPVSELPHKLAYADERRLAKVAHELIALLQSDGPAALPPLPPSSPRRRPQTHSHARNRPPRRRARGGRLRSGRVTVPLRLPGIAAILALLALLCAPSIAAEPDPAALLTVRIDSVTPDVVTTSSEPTVTVTATVTNVGDQIVRDIAARLEHGAAVTSSSGLRTSLYIGGQFEPIGEFVTVSKELDRGQAAGFTFTVPIRAAGQPSLGIDAPGVYPMLTTVDGTPEGGEPTRLDEARFLLPVTGVPPDSASSTGNALADVVAPDTTKPVAVTMLWPLADKPRLAPGVPGGTSPVRLMNDDLAVSLAAGGRLDSLLGAAEFATSPGAIEPAAGLDRALCLAVDPDLLVTVNAMTGGYVVADAANGLGTESHPGAGQAAAVAWLDRLRGLARRMCVTATPYAQADLGALQRVGDDRLAAAATGTAADIVDKILGVTSVRGATVLGDGPLTTAAVELLDTQNPTVAITAEPPDAGLTVRRLSDKVVLAPFDPAVGAALAGVGTDPAVPAYLDDTETAPVDHDSPVARRQDAVGALVWRALQPSIEPRTQILLPPLKWSPQPDDARAMLTALANAMRGGLAKPRPLDMVISESAATPADESGYQVPEEAAGRFDDDVVDSIRAAAARQAELTAALTTDARTGLTGPQYTAPLREDMLRALSQTEPAASRNDIARQRLAVTTATIEDLFGAVTIVSPGDSYTLATERSALPLALRNDLSVPIRVRLEVNVPPGMTVTDVGEQEVPPGYLPLRVPVEVHLTQRVAVDVTLRTPDGVQLGEAVRLSVHSNAYGKLLFAITLAGGAVLALLVGRRLYHRFRGQPDRADLDRPRHRMREDR